MIHLVRHGETDGNQSHFVGRRDLPLNAVGQAQAKALVPELSGRPIRAIVASPLQRAQATAQPLAQRLGLPVQTEMALIEFDFGLLQDLPKSGHQADLRKNHQRVPVPGGESLMDVWMRLLPFAQEIMADGARFGDLVIVGHYWSNRLLRGQFLGLSFEDTLKCRDYKPKTGSVLSFEATNGVPPLTAYASSVTRL